VFYLFLKKGRPRGARRAPEGPSGLRRGPGGAPEGPSGPRRGPGGALRFLGTSKSDFADVVGFVFRFLQILTVFRHVEVGSFPKEPDFDLFARAGRRGGGIPRIFVRLGNDDFRGLGSSDGSGLKN
jgi:hypothetical protein